MGLGILMSFDHAEKVWEHAGIGGGVGASGKTPNPNFR